MTKEDLRNSIVSIDYTDGMSAVAYLVEKFGAETIITAVKEISANHAFDEAQLRINVRGSDLRVEKELRASSGAPIIVLVEGERVDRQVIAAIQHLIDSLARSGSEPGLGSKPKKGEGK